MLTVRNVERKFVAVDPFVLDNIVVETPQIRLWLRILKQEIWLTKPFTFARVTHMSTPRNGFFIGLA